MQQIFKRSKRIAKIFIDAGHGDKDSGTVIGNIYEKDIAQSIQDSLIEATGTLDTCKVFARFIN